MWNSGMTLRQRSSGVSASVVRMWRAEAARLRCSSGTILGREVVPEVCSTSATSSACGGLARSTAAGAVPASGRSSNQPAGAVGGRVQAQDRAPVPPRHRDRRPLVAVGHDQRLGPQVGQVEVELLLAIGGDSSGAVVAPQATAMNAVAISGPFGSTMATRSLRPMPWPARLASVASASARSSP